MTASGNQPQQLSCPTCGKRFAAEQLPQALPFCSYRCQQIDLGRWLDGENGLPVEPGFDEDDPNL